MASSFPSGDQRLGAGICAPLAQRQINLTLLTQVAGEPGRGQAVLFCTAATAGAAGLSLLQTVSGPPDTVRLREDTCILSLYPHNQRPEIMGRFLCSLAGAGVRLHGLASSPAAICAVIPAAHRDPAVQALFRYFQFSAYPTPEDFQQAQQPPPKLLREVVASYQEKVIRIYGVVQEPSLEFWEVRAPIAELVGGGGALVALRDLELELPFLVGVPREEELLMALGTRPRGGAGGRGAGVEAVLKKHLPGHAVRQRLPSAAVVVHGPHFGDRYGIACTMLTALEEARIFVLSLSCAVSTISALVRRQDLAAAVQVLEETFEAQTSGG